MDYKEYLDKARIKQLAELQARYNQVYAKERAEAASSLIAGHRQLRRGLQNVGLAGRKGNLISGREKTAALEARRRYREYNAGLSRAANTFTTAAGQRMARQAIDDENRAKRAEAYAKWGDEYAAAKAEAEQEYAAKLEEAKQEHLQYAQEYQNSYNAYLAQQAQYQAWLQQQAAAQQGAQQELIDPRFQGNNMQQAKQDLLAARADQQRLQAEIQRLQMQQMAQDGVDPRLSGAQNTQQAKLQAATAARLNTLQRQYASLQEKIQRAEGITKPQNRNEYEIWRDAQNAQAKLNEQAQYAANMQKWQATINQAANITKPKNRYENEALKEAELARQQMAKAQAEMARKEMASKVTGMAGVLLQLSDEEFKLRYDAAERAYKLALQNAKILRQDSSSSMDDLSSDADRIEAQATQNFVAFEQANALREQVSEGNLYWNTFKPDAHNEYNKPSVRLIGNLNKGEFQTPIRTQDYLNAVKEYNPQAYNKMHDTDSKYAAAIHEYGRLGVLDSMNVSDAARDLLDYDETFLGKALRHSYADAYDVAMALVMTDEEKNRFDSFLANGQDDKADKYFEYLRDSGILDARAMQLMGNRLQAGIKDEIEKNGKLGLILSTLWTIPANVANGLIQPVASMFDTSASPYQASIRDIPNVMREAISQNLSQGGAFAYQTGMSIGDSLMSMALGGRIGGVALGGAAYNSAYREAINRGLSAEEARLTAFGTGFNEMLFETLSIGTLLEKTGKSAIKASRSAFVNWLVNTAVQAGVEGSEEVFTDIANNLWDKSVNGIVSEELTSIREYMSQGMTLQQAKAKVQREHAMQLGMSFLGGALSGGVMAGVGQGVNAFMNRRIDQYGKQIVNGEADVDIATLEKFDYKSEQAQEILNSGKLTNTDYGTLAILRVQELVQRSEAYINQAVAEGKMPQQIADIYKKFAEHSVQTETNPDGITDEEAEKMMPYVDVIKNAEAIKQGLGKIVEQQTAARKEFDALSSEQKQQRLQNITNETTALRNAPSLRVGARESRLSGQSAAQEFTTRAKTDTITLNNDGSVKTANGSVTFDFGANKTVDAMTDNQARAIRFAAAVANKTGVNIKVEQEFVGDDRNKNGEYNPETNTIRINLSGTNSAIYTMSHELTHYLQANNKQAFSDLSKAIQKQLSRTDLVGSDLPADYQDIIGDYLTGDNTLFEALCAYEKERYAKEKINLTQAQVEEEVIARCCESFLGNSSLVADMTQNHTKSARAVYRFLSEIRADINALRSDASERMAERGYASDFSPEQGMLEQFADIDKIVKLWENGLRKVAKKNKASGDTKNEDIRFSMKDNVERKGDLIAVHNLSGDQLLRSIELGGFPMPSIAVMKQTQGHDRYGDVSVIFGKDTIDPQKSTANKVYGGDAWTPTYPTVEYKPRKTVADRIAKTYFNIARQYGYDAARPLYSFVYELERKLNNAGSEKALLDDLYNDIDMMRLYGQINGKERVEDVYQETRTEMSDTDKAVPQYLINALGKDFIRGYATPEGENPLKHRKEFITKHIKELDRVFGKMLREEFSFDEAQMLNVVENMTTREYMAQLQRALKIVNNDTVKIDRVYDKGGTEKAVRSSIDEKAYKEWLYDLFHGIIEKSGIRNNKGYYTDSGNQRSWDSLHEDETLENVVRVMRDMTDKGSNTFFSQSEMLALGTRNFKSISEIREHKDQLRHISDEEMSEAKTNIVNQFGDLMDEMRDKSESNYFIGRDRALQAMVEAVRRSRTPQGILNELKQCHGLNVTDDMGRRIADLLDEIADLPTEYFEAKPRRAVGLDEIKAVIMPQGEYAELKEKLDERGIPVVEYEKDNAEDRLRALNSDAVSEQRFSIMDKVRLSTSDGTRTFTYGDVTAKMYGNDVTLDGGKVRQRVQMLETLAERYDHVAVDASSEAEARAFENAGAKRVADEFSTGNEYGTYEFKFVESQFKRDSQFDAKQKANFAKAVLKQVGSRRNFTDQQMVKYRAALERAMTYLWNSTYGKGDQMAAFDAVDRLFDRILNGYSEMTEADADMRDALMSQMTKLKTANGRTYYQLDVTKTQMSEIRNAHGDLKTYANLLSKALGARVVVKQVDGARMLENTFTHATDSRIKNDTVEGNMPEELLRLAQDTMARRTNPYKSESNERAAKKEAMWDAALNIIGGEKSTQQKIREAVKEARAAERNAAKDKTAKAVDEARLAERMHEGALRAKDRRVMAERESDLKRRSVDREARLKQQFRETTARTNEERLKRDMRKAALKWNQRLVKLLANPTEASHVPVQLAREVAELTKTITEYIDSGTERGRINLDKIAKAYQQAFDDQATIRAAKKENIKYDPRGSVIDREMYDEQLVNMIDEMNDILADKSFKELSAREMMGLLNIIRGVAHTVYDANRMIGTTERKAIWQVGDKMVKELESAPKIKGSFARFFLEESLDLRRIAKVFSGSNENAEFVKLSDMLNRGAIEKERVARVLSGMFDPLTQQYGDEIRKWYGKNAEWIDTGITKNGRKVEITKGMRVSLAMHVLNAGNMRHIENGGVTIPSRELYAKGKLADAYANGTLVRLNADQINTIISQMTEAERAYVEVAKDFFHQRTGYYVNKTSLQLLGYRKATVENYFPIHTDRNYTKSDFASVVRDGSIEGQGFLKERVMASNPVYLEDITSVVNRQIKGVSLYAGLAVPMRNFNAVMNASVYEDENGNWVPRTTVRKAMTQSMGEYGAKVVQGFLQDVSGMSAVDVTPGEQLVAKLQTRYVKAVLLANLKVTLKQAASYPTAAAVIPWKYLSKALLKGGRNHRLISRADVDLINQYTPLYKMRLDGMANEITSIMAERGLEQKMPWLLGWITKMDVATVGRLWSAAEHMVADQQNLPVGSDEYYKAVAEVFNQTIQQTQPNFTPLQRNAALRSKNPVVRTLTLFGTQRMQNGGILIESAMELAHSKNMSKEAQAAAKAKFGRAVVSQLVQNVMLVAIGLVVDALRGRMTAWQDDDKDVTLESVAKVMGDQFLGNIFGSFLGGSEVWDIVSTAFKRATNANAYDTEFTVPSLDAIETIIGFFNKDSVSFVQYMSGDHTAEEKIARLKSFSFKVAKAAGYLTGFPFENIAKTIVKGWIPALQDIYDATQTGELIPWLHQSGKLDKAKTAANYKAWTKAGYSGRDYFYWEKQLNGVSGGRDGRIPILLDSDLTNEQKALMMQMFDTADGYADGTVFYNKKGEAIIDFTAPSEKQQALPKPNEEPSEAPNAEPTAEPTPKPTENPLTEARQEGVQAAVKLGVPEQTAFDAFLAYQNMGKNKDESDGYSRNDEFREWLFKNVDSPEQMAVLEYQVIGQASSVKGAITYRDSGVVYRDYTNESWFKLSEHNLAKDGTNKRYEAGKQLEKTGLKVDKTVAIYDGLKELTKKAEWIDYLKNQNLNDDQIRIFLWSRGWKY